MTKASWKSEWVPESPESLGRRAEQLREEGVEVILPESPNPLNAQTTGIFGRNVAGHQQGFMHSLCLKYAIEFRHPYLTDPESDYKPPPNYQAERPGKHGAVLLGAGDDRLGITLGLAGFRTRLYDITESHRITKAIERTFRGGHVAFVQGDLRKLKEIDLPDIQIAFSERFLHYLKFSEAKTLLKLVGDKMPLGARFFIHASGLESELGNNYPDRDKPVEHRYAFLAAANREKHNIHAPVCLYGEEDLINLMGTAGLYPRERLPSRAGVRGVFEKRQP